jgi:hypothetical protein
MGGQLFGRRVCSLYRAVGKYRYSNKDRTPPFAYNSRLQTPIIMSTGESSDTPSGAHASVLMPSEAIPADALHIKGPNFNNAITLQELLESYEKIGFQATGLAKAIKIVENMVSLRCCLSFRSRYI